MTFLTSGGTRADRKIGFLISGVYTGSSLAKRFS